jgi:hypothetical protein
MIKIGGDNIFRDNIFDWFSWAADVFQTPAELKTAFDSLGVIGKRISGIVTVGGNRYFSNDYIEEIMFQQAESLSDGERNGIDPHFWYDPLFTFGRTIEIDEPFVIIFEDDARLEIDFSEGSSVAIGMNSIPTGIEPAVYSRNFNPTKFFSVCVGQKVLGIEINTTNEIPMFTGSHGLTLNENQEEFIKSFNLVLSGGVKLRFQPDFDYGIVTATDYEGKTLDITLGEMEKIVHNMNDIWTERGFVRYDTQYMKNFGLADLGYIQNRFYLFRHMIPGHKIFHGYKCDYLYKNFGYAEMIATLRDRYGDSAGYIIGFNNHKIGNCHWRLRVANSEIIDKDDINPYFFKATFKERNGDGEIPINIIHADVVPSYLEDDEILMQIVAFPISVNYRSAPQDQDEIRTISTNLSFEGEEKTYRNCVLIKGQVRSVTKCEVQVGDNKAVFFDVTVSTPLGAIELAHTIDFVETGQRHLIKNGKVLPN